MAVLGEVLQHSDLLGPFISQQSTTVAYLQSLFRQHSDSVRSVSRTIWDDGMQHSCFLLSTGTLEEELNSMIMATIEAYEGERAILPLGCPSAWPPWDSSFSLNSCCFMHGIGGAFLRGVVDMSGAGFHYYSAVPKFFICSTTQAPPHAHFHVLRLLHMQRMACSHALMKSQSIITT